MDLLVVTGSAALASALERTLETAGHQATVVTSVAQLDELFRDHPLLPFDAVVLDDLAPAAVRDGLARRLHDPEASLGRHIRVALLSTPSLSSASRSDQASVKASSAENADDTSSGTSSAADDDQSASASPAAASITPDVTVVKPFSDAELLSYLSLLQSDDGLNGNEQADGPALLIHGDLTLDTREQRAYYRGGKPLALSPREYSALEALVRSDGQYLSFDDLSRLVFGDGAGFAEQRTVMDTTMYSLTRKLRRLGFFITQHGHQYRIR